MNIVKKITKLFLNQVADFFPYFFIFYLLSFIISLFFESWKLFFNWRVFHISVAVLAILAMFSQKSRSSYVWKRIRVKKNAVRNDVDKNTLKIRTFKFNKIDHFKFSVIFLILSYSIFKGIYIIELIILLFALISVFFIIDHRIAAGLASFFLMACPILLFFQKTTLAETSAVYAYYFLVIIAATQMREHLKKQKPSKKHQNKFKETSPLPSTE